VTRPLTIRPARDEDLDALVRLRRAAVLATPTGVYTRAQLRRWADLRREAALRERIADACVLLAEREGEILGTNALDLDRGEMVALFVHPQARARGLGRRLVVAIERLAITYGIERLDVSAALPSVDFYRACGYRPCEEGAEPHDDPRTELPSLAMERAFPQRRTRYAQRVRGLLLELGIPTDYGRRHRMPLQPEAKRLDTIGPDIHEREQRLAPGAARAWFRMRGLAARDGVLLQTVSAYRSVGYQAGIVARKREAGQSMDRILAVSAAPGYSEHHTGRALDLTTPGYVPLEEEFEDSPAFEWLTDNAADCGFRLSFPRDNRHGVIYEPWHWAWSG
jgi:D-alanyl-D-alanine carboxypeptidase